MEFEDGDLMQQQGKFKLHIQKPSADTGDLNQKQLRKFGVHVRRCEEERVKACFG